LDPFTGTGTFITRLLQSGLIGREELPNKYKNEIHANEIVLLAYYIAAINIESAYYGITEGEYEPFGGICLTDTFQMYEKEDLISALLEDNSARRKRQKKLDIRVIIGNPPYSVGQKDDNDDAANLPYPSLDARIQSTYVKESTGNPRSLYDSYIRAIRWASDRVGDHGVIGFVTNAGFIEGKAADGVRKCLVNEFSSIYIVHLRGNARTSGEQRRKERDNIFGLGSRAPIAITLLVKNPGGTHGQIFFHDIGDYLSREEKLAKLFFYGAIDGLVRVNGWTSIVPDKHGDWLSQRNSDFEEFIPLGDKSKACTEAVFLSYSSGVKTNRDAWTYNASKKKVLRAMEKMISFYNQSIDAHATGDINDATRIGWSWLLRERFRKKLRSDYSDKRVRVAMYRPFNKRWLYYDPFFNENRYKMAEIFPDGELQAANLMIVVKQGWRGVGQLALMVDSVIDVQSDGGTQCFPRFLYATNAGGGVMAGTQLDLADVCPSAENPACQRRDAISDHSLLKFQTTYPGSSICKDDIFYYVYGVLHSSDYRERFSDNLSKELPRIPFARNADDFWAFSKAGRHLAHLHVNYESVEMYPALIDTVSKQLDESDYRVEKMRHGKNGKEKDLSIIHYNDRTTISGIPLNAYDYIVNGKSAIEWVMERQCVKTDKASGIVNDANDWAVETMANPKYPLELLLRVITVSVESMKIVNTLPRLDV
jgi:predicted helicase